MKYAPKPYQKRAVRRLLEEPRFGLFMDPGLGKTSVVLAAYKLLRKRSMVCGILVVAPLRVAYDVWPVEASKWDDFSGLSVAVLHGAKGKAELSRRHDVYVVNPEGLPWLERELSRRGKWPFDMLVVDESTKFKHTNTQRFKLLKRMLPRFSRRYILTGTPVPQGFMDLFGQIYVLDEGRVLGRYITHFRHEFFVPTGYGGYDWKLQRGAEERITKRVAPLTLRLSAEEELALPRLFTLPELPAVRVTLPAKARRLYDDMEKTFLAELGEGEDAWAVNAAVASMKCRQLANGSIYVDGELLSARAGPRRWKAVHDEKLSAVCDLLEELGGKPTMVAYDFHHERDRLLDALGDPPVIGAGVSPKRTSEVIRAWNAGEVPVLLANPQSVGHGLNLQGGRAVVFHSLPWSLENYLQFIRRVWRQGQEHPVYVYHVAATDTVDEVILATLSSLEKSQRRFMEALRSYASGRKQ